MTAWEIVETTTDLRSTVGDLVNGLTYTFAVRSYRGALSERVYSGWSDARTVPLPVRPPTGLSATAGDGSITLQWDAVANDGYYLYRVRMQRGAATTWSDPASLQVEPGSDGRPSATVSRLINGQRYRLQVGRYLAGALQVDPGWSGTEEATPSTVPGQVETLTATTAGDDGLAVSSVVVNWIAPADGGSPITGYNVQYKVTTASSWTRATGAITTRTTTLTGTNGKAYYVQVQACNAVGCGEWSASERVNTPPGQVATPTATTAGAGGLTVSSVVVNWSAPADGGSPITGYNVRYKVTTASSWTRVTGAITTTTTTLELANGDDYYVQVRACNPLWCGKWSASAPWMEPASSAPATPTNLGSATGDGTITLTWDSVTGADTYEVQQWYGEGSNPRFRTLPFDQFSISFSGPSATISGLTNNGEYAHGVRSKNSAGESALAEIHTPLPLLAPTGLDVVPMPQRSARINWMAPSANPSGTNYQVRVRALRGTWEDARFNDNRTIELDKILASDEGLAKAGTYEIRVKTTSGSVTVDSKTIKIIDSPIISVNGDSSLLQGPPAQGSTAGRAIVTWKRQQDATSYTLRWRKLGPDANGRTHSSDVWQLDGRSLPDSFEDDHKEKGISSSRTHFTIQPLDLREIYAIQLSYLTDDGWVFSARDAYVWPAASKPGSNERVAGYPFFGHYSNKTYEYRVCEETFYPDDEAKQEEWVALIVDALEQWETATNRFIEMTPEYKDSSDWADPDKPEFKDCTTYPSWWAELLIPWRVADDARRSEIRMLELPSGITDVGELTNIGQMLLDPFKLCVLDAPACTTSLVGYGRQVRQASTVLPSADITFNGNMLESVVPKRPSPGPGSPHAPPSLDPTDVVRFNTCMEGGEPKPVDGSIGDTFYAYWLAVHESGHALGLSDWTLAGTAGSVAVLAFNGFITTINLIDILPGFPDLPDIPKLEGVAELTEEAMYRASHTKTPGSVMNYDGRTKVNEPDCSPHPLDVMAIYALYQTDGR